MREIKFRAWDKKHKKLISWRDICCYYNLRAMLDPVVYDVMQYTGLKDKNGKEIYEGDIIRESDGDGGYIYAKVVYYKDGFMGKEKGFEPEYPISDFQNEAEVIGNIYENPELSEV